MVYDVVRCVVSGIFLLDELHNRSSDLGMTINVLYSVLPHFDVPHVVYVIDAV